MVLHKVIKLCKHHQLPVCDPKTILFEVTSKFKKYWNIFCLHFQSHPISNNDSLAFVSISLHIYLFCTFHADKVVQLKSSAFDFFDVIVI